MFSLCLSSIVIHWRFRDWTRVVILLSKLAECIMICPSNSSFSDK